MASVSQQFGKIPKMLSKNRTKKLSLQTLKRIKETFQEYKTMLNIINLLFSMQRITVVKLTERWIPQIFGYDNSTSGNYFEKVL